MIEVDYQPIDRAEERSRLLVEPFSRDAMRSFSSNSRRKSRPLISSALPWPVCLIKKSIALATIGCNHLYPCPRTSCYRGDGRL